MREHLRTDELAQQTLSTWAKGKTGKPGMLKPGEKALGCALSASARRAKVHSVASSEARIFLSVSSSLPSSLALYFVPPPLTEEEA